jgi:hypothetical protein
MSTDGGRPPGAPKSRSPAARVLGAGARGAERLAGATGVDKAIEDATEEAIVRAMRSPAVERAIVRVLVEENAIGRALEQALTSEEVAKAVVDALDSEVADRVWEELLASDKAQMLVERIAEAPEVRAAIAQQGMGLITDIGHRLTNLTEALDDSPGRSRASSTSPSYPRCCRSGSASLRRSSRRSRAAATVSPSGASRPSASPAI